MDKKTAESYVIFGIKGTVFTKKKCTSFLPFNIIGLGIAMALYPKMYFFVVTTLLMFVAGLTSIFYKIKWSVFIGFLSQATQFIEFIITLDCIYFAMYHNAGLFVWIDYLLTIIIQIAAFGVSIILVINSAKNHNINKKPVINTKVGIISGLTFVLTSILLKIYIPKISLCTVLVIINLLINIIIILLDFAVAMACYRAFLIKKFKLIIDLNCL